MLVSWPRLPFAAMWPDAPAPRRRPHRLAWVVEDLWDEPSYLEKPMFGCRGSYLHGRLVLVLAARSTGPWRGLLLPTAKEHHASLLREFPALRVHPVLGKWLYLSEASEAFEESALALAAAARAGDGRIGVEPGERSRKRAKHPRRPRAKK